MKENTVNKLFLLLSTITLAACSGYTPLYGELGTEMDEIGIKSVKMKDLEKNVGERRYAQNLFHKLNRVFRDDADNKYDLYVILDKNEEAIATRSDDTDKRKSVTVIANMELRDIVTGQVVYGTSISRSSSYTTQQEPFATDAARTKAIESIISTLYSEIIQRAALWFRGYTVNEDSK